MAVAQADAATGGEGRRDAEQQRAGCERECGQRNRKAAAGGLAGAGSFAARGSGRAGAAPIDSATEPAKTSTASVRLAAASSAAGDRLGVLLRGGEQLQLMRRFRAASLRALAGRRAGRCAAARCAASCAAVGPAGAAGV